MVLPALDVVEVEPAMHASLDSPTSGYSLPKNAFLFRLAIPYILEALCSLRLRLDLMSSSSIGELDSLSRDSFPM